LRKNTCLEKAGRLKGVNDLIHVLNRQAGIAGGDPVLEMGKVEQGGAAVIDANHGLSSKWRKYTNDTLKHG
jgi:phage tail protein X